MELPDLVIKELRASYTFQYGQHMVLVDQWKEGERGAAWARTTVLFCPSAEYAREVVNGINAASQMLRQQ